MRATILIAFFALGAAPSPSASEALECRLPYADAVAALSHLRVQSHEDYPGEDEYRHKRKLDPAHLTAFGFPLRSGGTLKVDAISHETLVITITLDAPYAAVLAAALASRGKRECFNTDGPPGTCNVEERQQDGWTNDFLLVDLNGRPTLTCLYTRPAA